MANVETLRVPPSLGGPTDFAGRPGSLVVTDVDHTVSVCDAYSPYPAIMGSDHSRDPFGLNNFLLSPFESHWEYTHAPPPAVEVKGQDPERPAQSLSRPVSINPLRRPSPLAQPPVSADGETKPEEEVVIDDDDIPVASTDVVAEEALSHRPPSTLGGRRGLRALITRKSTLVTSGDDWIGASPILPEVTISRVKMDASSSQLPAVLPPPDSPVLDDPSPSTRTASMCSAMSSGSSTDGSCDGIQTPSEAPPAQPRSVDVSAASVRLAEALDNDQDRRPKSTWRNWLNGRRSSFLGLRSETGTTLLDSPRESVLDLGPEIPEADPIRELDTSEAARAASQLRRLSLAKLGSLRMPSPHPLSLLLARQHVNLPDEVAFSIPATKRVFPISVNTVQYGSTEFAPSQGGLRVALAVRNLVTSIDAGARPTTVLDPKKATAANNILRPRGVRDFIARAPFEERMVCIFPDEHVVQVSMARRGFAIYDLEFSDYIVALSESEDAPITWSLGKKQQAPNSKPVSRSSSASLLPPARAAPAKVTKVEAVAKRTSVDKADNRKSLTAPKLSEIKRVSLAAAPAPAKSSLRNAKPKATTWDDSSDEEDVSDDDEAAAPKPSAARTVRPSVARTQSAAPLRDAARARQSVMIDHGAALDVIARARERRAQCETGECERKADSKRMSMMPTQHRSASSSTLPMAGSKPPMAPPQMSSRDSGRSLAIPAKADRPQPTRKASSSTLAAAAAASSQSRKLQHQQQQQQQQRPPSSLPSSPRSGPQGDRRRVVSQYEMAPALQPRASMMGMTNMYAVPQVPQLMPAYSPALMHRASMMFPPVVPVMAPAMQPMQQVMGGMPYHPQYAHTHSPQLPQMYLPPTIPGTGRRRAERPVS